MSISMWILFAVGILVLIVIILAVTQNSTKRESVLASLAEPGSSIPEPVHFQVGDCIAGLWYTPPAASSTGETRGMIHMTCVVTPEDLIFLDAGSDDRGRIPRDLVSDVVVDVFSLAFPKTHKQSRTCVLIDWEDSSGSRQETVFEFKGPDSENAANRAAQSFRQWVLPKRELVKQGERRCQHCRKIIKSEAIECRFCGGMLVDLFDPV